MPEPVSGAIAQHHIGSECGPQPAHQRRDVPGGRGGWTGHSTSMTCSVETCRPRWAASSINNRRALRLPNRVRSSGAPLSDTPNDPASRTVTPSTGRWYRLPYLLVDSISEASQRRIGPSPHPPSVTVDRGHRAIVASVRCGFPPHDNRCADVDITRTVGVLSTGAEGAGKDGVVTSWVGVVGEASEAVVVAAMDRCRSTATRTAPPCSRCDTA